jgi:hypothetical protein
MSTNYRFTDKITVRKFKNAIKKAGLSISKVEDKTDICVTDGECYLWFYSYKGEIAGCCRYGANYNAADAILQPLADELKTDFISEHDEGYWEDEDDDAC